MPYPSLADFKARLGITTTDEDASLMGYLQGARDWVEGECSRTFVAVRGERVFHKVNVASAGRSLINLPEFVSVQSVRRGGSAGELIPIDTYRPFSLQVTGMPYEYLMFNELDPWGWLDSDEGICTVTADWGYSVSPPDAVSEAMLMVAESLLRRRQSRVVGVELDRLGASYGEAMAISDDARQLLFPFKRAR